MESFIDDGHAPSINVEIEDMEDSMSASKKGLFVKMKTHMSGGGGEQQTGLLSAGFGAGALNESHQEDGSGAIVEDYIPERGSVAAQYHG